MSAVAQSQPRRSSAARPVALARAGLALVAVAQAEVGIWGLLAPRSFFDNFPGAGHQWVSVLPPYNEHLLRDYAAAELGFAVLLLAAVIWFERRLVLVAGATVLVATVPHFVYHLTTTDHFSTGNNVASLGAFVLELVAVAGAMVVASRERGVPSGAD
jgi:hypothetical protein